MGEGEREGKQRGEEGNVQLPKAKMSPHENSWIIENMLDYFDFEGNLNILPLFWLCWKVLAQGPQEGSATSPSRGGGRPPRAAAQIILSDSPCLSAPSLPRGCVSPPDVFLGNLIPHLGSTLDSSCHILVAAL